MRVSKEDLARILADEKEANACKPNRGPKSQKSLGAIPAKLTGNLITK